MTDRRAFIRSAGAFALGAAGLPRVNLFEALSSAPADRMAWWREARVGMFKL